VAIAEGFGERFRVVRGSTNGGIGSARNRGIEVSAGELVAFLDADDLWFPDYLERQVALYDASRRVRDDVGIVVCDARIVGPDGYRAQTYMEGRSVPQRGDVDALGQVELDLRQRPFAEAIVEEVGRFATDLVGTEDYDLWLKIVERGYRVVANRRPLAVYRLTLRFGLDETRRRNSSARADLPPRTRTGKG
jgi:glycosyltransferase involved in cell wall biosynthesis